jgi:hypothetical protein
MKRREHSRSALLGPLGIGVLLVSAGLAHCGSSSGGNGDVSCASVNPDAAATTSPTVCYPDNDGITGGSYTIALAVNDTGFTSTGSDDNDGGVTKNIIATQNDAMVTLTLTNTGTTPHGFQVLCTPVCPSYPSLPVGCSPLACFPSNSTIAPIMPGTTMTITFDTPTPDGLLYPFASSAPADSTVPGLNGSISQWSLM